MARGVLAGCLWVWLALLGTMPAHAASDLQLRHAADGTWHVIGSGWRPGDQLVVSVGASRFRAYVDRTGDFEVATGLTTLAEVAVHRPRPRALAMLRLTGEPNPLVAALAQGLAEGAALMGLSIGLLLLGLGIRRWRQASRP